MKIDNAMVRLFGQHDAVERHTRKESLKAWIGTQRPDFEGDRPASDSGRARAIDTLAISEAARNRLAADAQALASAPHAPEAAYDLKLPEGDPKIRLIRLILEKMTGQKIRVLSLDEFRANVERIERSSAQVTQQAQAQPQGWGVEYDLHESYYEFERTSFSAEGVIRTKDGREISFSLDLSVSREFSVQSDVSIRLGDAQTKDPLIVNFDGTTAQLSSTRFSFDIDADGQHDSIAALGKGSGFLALDLTGNGRIDNGSELFGARTGDGFAELEAYDDDGNGWIDEQDRVYGDLKVWSGAGGSEGQPLSSLMERGVGAIHLGKTATPFDVKDQQNTLLGSIRSSSVYLTEEGKAGSIQQVDLAV